MKSGTATYPGFNMGAGENALFEIFSTAYAAGPGALLVMDEVELGLHAEAQRKFINELKNVCLEMHTQVICTTHSKEIFDCLPDDARFYVESVDGRTRVIQGISSEFAFSKLSALNGLEADILVEDEVAKSLLLATIPSGIRARVSIAVIGSASALSRQLAAAYLRGETKPVLAVFDGDQTANEKNHLDHAKRMAETADANFDPWYRERIAYFPGTSWPEAWILGKATEVIEDVAAAVGAPADELRDIIRSGIQAGKHNEFFEIGRLLGMEPDNCLQLFARAVAQRFGADLSLLLQQIEAVLARESTPAI